MFEKFSDDARRVVVLAQEEARLLDHNYIGTEHLLLAMFHTDVGGVGLEVLASAGITYQRAYDQVVEIIGRGGSAPSVHVPFTPRAKQVLELSLREALEVGDDELRPEHILLGLIREGTGVGVRVLEALGVDLSQLRYHTIGRRGLSGPAPKRAVARGAMSAHAILRSAPGVGPGPVIPRCPFCGRGEDKAEHLLVAGGTSLCDQCARDAVAQLDALPDDARKRVRFRRREVGLTDKDAAMRGIERAFEAVIGPAHLPPADALWAVEGGAATEAMLRQLDEASGHAPVVVNDVTVERVRFLDGDEAEVSLGIWMAGSPQPLLQSAHAVREEDGNWKVSRATVEFYAAQASQFRRPPL
jgi:hypothetical protein